MEQGIEFKVSIRPRPWWVWMIGVPWLIAEVILLQTAIASVWEYELTAAGISAFLFVVLLAIYGAFWYRQAG